MKLTRHLVWFDFLALRMPLAVWGAFLLVEGMLFYVGPLAAAGLPEFGRTSLTIGLNVIRLAGAAIITALLVHGDSTIGTTAFWLSRPIPRSALLASKVISAVLWLAVLPGIVTAAVLLSLGLTPAEALIGGATTASEQLTVLLAALAVASVTKDLVQLIVAGVIAMGLVLVEDQTLLRQAATAWPELARYLGAVVSGSAAAALATGFACVAAVYQYMTRRLRVSIGLLSCAIVLSSMVAPSFISSGGSWSYPLLPAAAPAGAVAASDVVLSVVPDSQIVTRNTITERGQVVSNLRLLSLDVDRSRVPADVELSTVDLTSLLTLPDQSVVRFSTRWPTVNSTRHQRRTTDDDPPYRGLRALLGNAVVIPPPSAMESPAHIRVSQLREDLYNRFLGQPARLQADVSLVAYRCALTFAVDARPGEAVRLRDGGALSIETATVDSSGIRLGMRLSYLAPGYRNNPYGGPVYYLLWNRQRGSAVAMANVGRYRSTRYNTIFWNHSAATETFQVSFKLAKDSADRIVLDEAWLKGAQLVRIDFATLGTITRPLVVENLVIGGVKK